MTDLEALDPVLAAAASVVALADGVPRLARAAITDGFAAGTSHARKQR